MIAHPADAPDPAESLEALGAACAGLPHELLLVRGCADRSATTDESVRELLPGAGSGELLVPELWANGLRAARGDVVAFTTSHMVVSHAWARSLLAALKGGATGAGGGIELAPDASTVDCATWLLRYSAFHPPFGPGPVREIAGDNAAYRRDALQRYADLFGEGFWEVEFHARVHAEGGWLEAVPEATAYMIGSERLTTFMRHRFSHGARFGEWRVRSAGSAAARVVLAAPIVPFVLTGRALRRVKARRRLYGRMLLGLPAMLLLAAAWAAGEAYGAVRGRRSLVVLREEVMS